MSGAMYRTFIISLFCVGVVAMWTTSGFAFQLVGGGEGQVSDAGIALRQAVENEPSLDTPPLKLGESGEKAPSDDEGLNIWIPGIGVVAKMPRLDFGLEMLYGSRDDEKDGLGLGSDFRDLDSDFAIRGTIKHKF